MSQFQIIRDSKKLNESLNAQPIARDAYYALLHLNAVSVLAKCNETGGINEINRFHGMLNANEQTAFRNYVRRFQETGEKNAEGKPVKTNLAFLLFKGGEWRIDTDTPTSQRRKGSPFQKHAEKVLINPDGKTSKPFYEQDNLADINLFDDKSVLDGIKRMLTTIQNGSTDKREVKVTEQTVSFLKDVVAKAEALRVKLDADAMHQDNVVQLHARPHEKPANTEAAQEKRTTPARKRAAANVEAKKAASA